MKKIIQKTTFNFNKEIVFGELGALISAPSVSYAISMFTKSNNIISFSAVVGAIVGASIFWVAMRTYDKRVRNKMSIENLASDVVYFTPAAFLTTLLVYYPTLFFLSHNFLTEKYPVLSSVILSQLIAFSAFLIIINLYRYWLAKVMNKVL